MSKWREYRLKLSNDRVHEDAVEFTKGHIIVYVQAARGILEDRELRAGVIGDEGILKKITNYRGVAVCQLLAQLDWEHDTRIRRQEIIHGGEKAPHSSRRWKLG